MASKLCERCRQLSVRLLDQLSGDIALSLSSPHIVEDSTTNACPLCAFFVSAKREDSQPAGNESSATVTVNLSKVPLEIGTETSSQRLSRATMAATRADSLLLGGDWSSLSNYWGVHESTPAQSMMNTARTDAYIVPEPWCHIEPMADLVGPINNARIMREWLSVCVKTHPTCSSSPTSFIPTRLLHIDVREIGRDVRLISTESWDLSSLPEYAALSHCWGPEDKHPITTLRKNLEEHMERIPFEKLSATFRDAVEVTRQLGVSYLWIDSLCILQKDREDWVTESTRMEQVYECAYCTLSALSSPDSTGGFRQSSYIQNSTGQFTDVELRSEGNQSKVRIRIFFEQPNSWSSEYYGRYISDPFEDSLFVDPADDNFDPSATPLRLRAWTLQERELSRRLVHFGKNQILWECRELKVTAQLPWAEHSIVDGHAWKKGLQWQHLVEGDLNAPHQAKERWQYLVEDFTQRTLTNGTDKLPAIGGLAKQYQRKFPGSSYVAGIWTEHLPASLLWKSANVGCHRYASYVAPSWSWASLAGPVTHNLGATSILDNFLYPAKERKISKYWQDEGTHIEVAAKTTLKYAVDPYGMVSAGSLHCSNAYIVQADPLPNFTEWYLADSTERYDYIRIDGRGVTFHRDSVDDETVGLKPFVLRIERDLGCCIHWRGLVLVQVSEPEQIYRRIGLAKCIKDEFFMGDHPGPQSLRVI